MEENVGLNRSKDIQQMGCGNLDRILIWGGKKLENTFLGQFRKLE